MRVSPLAIVAFGLLVPRIGSLTRALDSAGEASEGVETPSDK
jgi:hypothetical protein